MMRTLCLGLAWRPPDGRSAAAGIHQFVGQGPQGEQPRNAAHTGTGRLAVNPHFCPITIDANRVD